ncbi:hypothetical protein K8R43_03870 [archaeon]|nr:hypothetical protein [archaeon]
MAINKFNTKEITENAELREVIADEINARSNVLQAEAQFESAKWMKYSAIGTFFMAVATVVLAVVTYLN